MKTRFEGDEGKRRLLDALNTQKIAIGDSSIAAALVNEIELIEVAVGKSIIDEGAADNDIFFILVGSFSIIVKGTRVATRTVGDHVGEMSAIDPSTARTASVVADSPSLVGKISESALAGLASSHPNIWRNLAKELVVRLAQRNTLIGKPNERPKIFIISSKEALMIAQEIQSILSHDDCLITVWTDGAFFASTYALDNLENMVDQSDFAIAIAQPDDEARIRNQTYKVARDNIIFELGLFMGRLTRQRAILFQPEGMEIRLPSDLQGLTAVSYKTGAPTELTALLAPACHEIRKIVQALGIRR